MPESELIFSVPADAGVAGLQLFAVLSPSLGHAASDPDAELHAILEILDREVADDNDLVFWHHLCAAAGMDGYIQDVYQMFTHYRVQSLILPAKLGCTRPVFERMETMAYVCLAFFCQRIVNASDDRVQAAVELEALIDLPNTLAALHDPLDDEAGTFMRIATLLDRVIRAFKPVHTDAEGFAILCHEGNVAWIPAPYLLELSEAPMTLGCRPFPRRQDLDQSRLIVGRAPAGHKVVVSHGWDAAYHVSPSGAKLELVARELQRLGATAVEDGEVRGEGVAGRPRAALLSGRVPLPVGLFDK